jgi:hypothetical protein
MQKDYRIQLARQSLKGLSIGDAFGDRFFGEREWIEEKINRREIPETTRWEFTNDTVMAIQPRRKRSPRTGWTRQKTTNNRYSGSIAADTGLPAECRFEKNLFPRHE